MSRILRATVVLLALVSFRATPLVAQDAAQDAASDSTRPAHATRAPVSIGNYPNVTGLRLNFRDRGLEEVRGANITVWSPHDPVTGTVRGLALGLPATGARDIHGLALGVFGVSAGRDLRGIALAGLGVRAGKHMKGIAIGGLGVGGGGPMEGLMLGGLGVGASGNGHGIMLGGIGAVSGGAMHGLIAGGLGAGVARDLTGIGFGGLAVGVAGNITGIVVGGIGTGAGGNITGLAVSGIATGAGGLFKGIGVSGVAVAAGALHGAFLAPAVGTTSARALVIAPILFRVQPDGDFTGVSVSSVNAIRGQQHGLSIGLVNYARSLRGAQIGLINIVANATSHKVLPIFNWGTGK